MEIRSNACEGKLNVELYSDDGYYLYTLPYTEEGWNIPDWLVEEQYEESKEKLRKIIYKDDEEEDDDEMPPINDQLAVTMNRRAMGDNKLPEAHYVESSDPKARAKRTPSRPPKPPMFLGKPQEEKYTDPRKVKVPPSVVKGILGTLGLTHLLDNRDKEERKRIEYEMERADKLRKKTK